jgi:N-acetylglucosaminyldiphosphoundecaprenol N-acetyl-beta-D-mannosaminyltransferase
MATALARVDVLGVPVTPCTTDEAVETVAAWIRSGECSFATFTGVHGVMEAQRDPKVLLAHREAGMVACDGAPMVWSSRWAGVGISDRVTGRDFMLACCARAEVEGWSSFFYGGKPGLAEQVVDVLRARFPNLTIAGTHAPPFHLDADEVDQVGVDAINASGADLVWVCLSTPKQELWMAHHRDRLWPTALFGVGAAFDYIAGSLPRAPRWMQRAGLEWLFRLLREPRRLARRYLRNNPAFIRAIARRRPRIISQ